MHHFLNAYQDVRELSRGELRALPNTLRVALIENLLRQADCIACCRAATDAPPLCAGRVMRAIQGHTVFAAEGDTAHEKTLHAIWRWSAASQRGSRPGQPMADMRPGPLRSPVPRWP